MKSKKLFLWGCVICMLTGCQSSSKSNDYADGVKALEEFRYEDAVGSFDLSIAENENQAQSYRGTGIAYLRQNKYAEAIAAFQSALDNLEEQDKKKNEPLMQDIRFYLATAQYQSKLLNDAVKTCDAILENGGDEKGYFLRGKINLELDAYEDAKSDFHKVVSKSTDYNDYVNIYRVYEANDMRADGETYLEQALEVKTKDKDANYNRGRIYYYLEEYEKAKEELIPSMNAGNKDAALFLGKVYLAMKDIASARAIYQEYLTQDENSAKAYNGLAYCDIAEEKYDNALENIQMGLKLEDVSEKQSLLFNEIVVYEKKLDFAKAKEKMADYLLRYPSDDAAVKESDFLKTR